MSSTCITLLHTDFQFLFDKVDDIRLLHTDFHFLFDKVDDIRLLHTDFHFLFDKVDDIRLFMLEYKPKDVDITFVGTLIVIFYLANIFNLRNLLAGGDGEQGVSGTAGVSGIYTAKLRYFLMINDRFFFQYTNKFYDKSSARPHV